MYLERVSGSMDHGTGAARPSDRAGLRRALAEAAPRSSSPTTTPRSPRERAAGRSRRYDVDVAIVDRDQPADKVGTVAGDIVRSSRSGSSILVDDPGVRTKRDTCQTVTDGIWLNIVDVNLTARSRVAASSAGTCSRPLRRDRESADVRLISQPAGRQADTSKAAGRHLAPHSATVSTQHRDR